MSKINMYAGIIYQYIIILSIVVFNGYFIFVKGELNEILIGALIGSLVTLPFKDREPEKKLEKKVEHDTIK